MNFDENELISKQKEICLKYGADRLSAPFSSIVGVAIETFERKLAPINGLRHHRGDYNDSGWFIWAGEFSTKSDFFKPIHVKHLLEICPKALDFLGLAPGWRFLIGDNNYEDVWFDHTLLNID